MSSRTFAGVARLFNLKVQVDNTIGRASVIFPGLSMGDFDALGNPSLWRVQNLLTMARIVAYHDGKCGSDGNTFLEYDKMTSDRMTFMASSEIELSEKFYEIRNQEQFPIKIAVHLGYIGKSSVLSVAEMTNGITGEFLGKGGNQVVSVSRETRKPTALPDWWRDKYKHLVVENKALIVQRLEKPDKVHKYDTKVSWSDTDRYRHTNQATYTRFCIDAATDASIKGYFSKLTGDIRQYHVKTYDVLYIGESLAGDHITVETWENDENPSLIHFQISKDEKALFQSSIEFHSTEPGTGDFMKPS
ncbi:unnamed protein product [Owenia fusiformis]|uniref:Uncharacterized protein n=1 Tax=Owenia fusiformis TaxID=6347 RepID=A0A8J1U9T6_OWEFU|nr:unnamed protein product [Owenia fusiformis]